MKSVRQCSLERCNNPHYAKNFCERHYKRLKAGYDMSIPGDREPKPAIVFKDYLKIPIGLNAKDGYAMVDKDFLWIENHTWYIDSWGYARNVKLGFMHHVILGKPKKGYTVDHINRVKLDNRRTNLRVSTHAQNSSNRGLRKDNKSGYKGVCYLAPSKKWHAYIGHNRKKINLGTFHTKESAASAYNTAAIKYHGDYAVLNKIS